MSAENTKVECAECSACGSGLPLEMERCRLCGREYLEGKSEGVVVSAYLHAAEHFLTCAILACKNDGVRNRRGVDFA